MLQFIGLFKGPHIHVSRVSLRVPIAVLVSFPEPLGECSPVSLLQAVTRPLILAGMG